MSYGMDPYDREFDHLYGMEEQEDRWEAQYAEELDRQMEAQYQAELAARYEGNNYLDEFPTSFPDDPEVTRTVNHTDSVAHQLLHLPIGDNDANAATVGEYLGLLLSTLWLQQEGFSGKRPFGNSDWTTPVYLAMGKAGLTNFTLDEDGYIEDFSSDDEIRADELILQAIRFAYYHG